MDSVDAVLLTKNSDRALVKCLESLYNNVPVHQLIVVDAYSTDNTHKILKEFNDKYHNVKIVYDNCTRASARQKGIQHVETEWFLFIDSDVVLSKNWFQKAIKNIAPDVGAVWGTEVWSTLENSAILKLYLIITRKIFEVRGGTHDTLIRTSLVKDIQIPTKLHIYEDAYIKDWITKKGFKAIPCYIPFCIHYRPDSVWTVKGGIGLIVEALTIGTPKMITKLLFAYGFYTGYSIYQFYARENKKKQ